MRAPSAWFTLCYCALAGAMAITASQPAWGATALSPQAAAQQGVSAPQPSPEGEAQQSAVVTAPVVVQPPDPKASAEELESGGDQLRGQRRFLDAIDYYKMALKKSVAPASASLWNKIGIADLQLQRIKDARKAFDKAIKIDKTRPELYNNRGAAEYGLKRYRNAIRDYRRALQIKEDSASFHSNLANALFATKEIPQAVAEFLRAVQLDPEVLDRHSQYGTTLQMTNSQDRAEYAYLLARIYARAGDFDRALEQLRHAMEDGYRNIKDVNKDADFAMLRKDPRFAELMSARPLAIPQ